MYFSTFLFFFRHWPPPPREYCFCSISPSFYPILLVFLQETRFQQALRLPGSSPGNFFRNIFYRPRHLFFARIIFFIEILSEKVNKVWSHRKLFSSNFSGLDQCNRRAIRFCVFSGVICLHRKFIWRDRASSTFFEN